MKLVPCYDTNLGVNKYKKTINHRLIEEFRDSDMDCAEVTDFTHCSSESCAAALTACARRYGILTIRAISRKNKVFLIKEPIE